MGRSVRIYIEAPSGSEVIAELIEPITEVDAFELRAQWASGGLAEIGPLDTADADELVRALRHFGLVCRVDAQTHQLGRMPDVRASAGRGSSAGRYVFGAAPEPAVTLEPQRRSTLIRFLRRRDSAS